MAQQDYPVINGQKHSFADVIITAAGQKFRGVTSINYKTARGMTDAGGTGPNRVGVALGAVKNEGSLEAYREDHQRLLARLGDGWSNVPITITVVYRTRIGAALITDTLTGVRLMDFDVTPSEGDEPVKSKSALNIGEVKLNGLTIA